MTPEVRNLGKGNGKRGAQPGNQNALKYGYYSRLFHPHETGDLDNILGTGMDDEKALLRVITRRTFEQSEESDDIDQTINVLGAMGMASIRNSRVQAAKQDLGDGDQAKSAISDAVNDILKKWGRI